MVPNRVPIDIRLAGASDRTAVGDMLARAFAEDPALAYIFPDLANRGRRLPRLFGLLYDTDPGAGMRLVASGIAGATLWRAPSRSKTSLWEMFRHAPRMVHALGGSIVRALRVANAIDAHHPSEPCWYLHVAGCDPAKQGRGIGGALIRDGLARIAGDRPPCFLETATDENLSFCPGLGFEVTGSWEVPSGGPRFRSMRRAMETVSTIDRLTATCPPPEAAFLQPRRPGIDRSS